MVSSNEGRGRDGSDPWKLYSMGWFQPDKILTAANHIFVAKETLLPFPRSSYIQPKNNFIN